MHIAVSLVLAILISAGLLPLFILHGFWYAKMTEESNSIVPAYAAHLLKNLLVIWFQAVPMVWYLK